MSTATLAAPTPVDVLNHKKRFAEALDARATARTALDKVKAAPRAAREGLMSFFRALHLDAIASSIGGAAVRLWETSWTRLVWAKEFIGRTFGWRSLALYAVTDAPTRGKVGQVAMGAYLAVTAVAYKVSSFIGKVPLIGSTIESAIRYPLALLDRGVLRASVWASKQADTYGDHWAIEWANNLVKGLLIWRAVRALVPSQYRFMFVLAYLFRPAKRALNAVKDDEATGKIMQIADRVKGTARAAAAEATDVVVDRIMDGPSHPVHGTRPGTEELDVIVVATGKRETVIVDVDSRGQKWVTWDGITYAAEEIGQGETDPIRPLPVDLVTKALKADEAAKAAAASSTAPLPRAVARTMSPPARRGGNKAGSQRR